MADQFDKSRKPVPSPSGPKKSAPAPAAGSIRDQAQKRAQAMTAGGRKPVGAGQFFQEAWVELKKTTWPTKDVLTKSTTVVLALVVATAVYVGALDFVLTKVMSPLFSVH